MQGNQDPVRGHIRRQLDSLLEEVRTGKEQSTFRQPIAYLQPDPLLMPRFLRPLPSPTSLTRFPRPQVHARELGPQGYDL